MKYLFDTDTIIFWLRGDTNIENKALSVGLDEIGFSIVSLAELYFGAYNSKFVEENVHNIQQFSETIALLLFDNEAAKAFGEMKANLKKSGNILLDADIMIASIAVTNNLTLVTNNTKHYTRIKELKIENWKI